MSPACTHKHSKGRGLLIFILVFTSFLVSCLVVHFSTGNDALNIVIFFGPLPFLLSHSTSFLPSPDLPHTVCISEPVTHGKRKVHCSGWARPTERLQRRKDLSALKKRSPHREVLASPTWLGKRSRMCTQAPPWTPDTPPQHNKGNAQERPCFTLPFPSAPSLFSL